jgi:Fe-S cluster assembly scaffold protein SufB
MNDAKNAHFWLIDHRIQQIAKMNQAVVLPSRKAWDALPWCREYFSEKPLEGYFVWIREQPNCPLFTCITLLGKNVTQRLGNVVVIEEGLHINLTGFCGSMNVHTAGSHQARGKIILRKGSSLTYVHIHSWKGNDTVDPAYEFILEDGVKLDYTYQVKVSPKSMNMHNTFICGNNSSVRFRVLANCSDSNVTIQDEVLLRGVHSSGMSTLRFVVGKGSAVKAISQMSAHAPARGHVDCQSLMIDADSSVSLIPEIVCHHKDASLTHEASIGKISEEQITYLRMRGMTEKQALELIINGFLKL